MKRRNNVARSLWLGAGASAFVSLAACGQLERIKGDRGQSEDDAPAASGVTEGHINNPPNIPDDMASVRDLQGNGGDAVVCRGSGGAITSIELFDYFEGRLLRELQPDLGSPSLEVLDKVRTALIRFARLDLEIAQQALQEADTFFANARIIDANLQDVPDQGQVIIAPECAIEQLAIRLETGLPLEKKFTVNQRLWDRMDNDQKAGTILHEVLYGVTLTWGHKNSFAARYLNTLISSHALDSYTPEQWREVRAKLQSGSPINPIIDWTDSRYDRRFVFDPSLTLSVYDAKSHCLDRGLALVGADYNGLSFYYLENGGGFRSSPLFEAMSGKFVLYGYYSYDDDYLQLIDVRTNQRRTIYDHSRPVPFVCASR